MPALRVPLKVGTRPCLATAQLPGSPRRPLPAPAWRRWRPGEGGGSGRRRPDFSPWSVYTAKEMSGEPLFTKTAEGKTFLALFSPTEPVEGFLRSHQPLARGLPALGPPAPRGSRHPSGDSPLASARPRVLETRMLTSRCTNTRAALHRAVSSGSPVPVRLGRGRGAWPRGAAGRAGACAPPGIPRRDWRVRPRTGLAWPMVAPGPREGHDHRLLCDPGPTELLPLQGPRPALPPSSSAAAVPSSSLRWLEALTPPGSSAHSGGPPDPDHGPGQ